MEGLGITRLRSPLGAEQATDRAPHVVYGLTAASQQTRFPELEIEAESKAPTIVLVTTAGPSRSKYLSKCYSCGSAVVKVGPPGQQHQHHQDAC